MSLPKPLTVVCVSTSFRGNSFLETCKQEGCTTILLTLEKHLDKAWCRESIDDLIALPSFNDWSVVKKTVSDIARTRKIDRLCAFDDYDVDLVAHLREHLRVPGMEESAARYFRDKLAMRSKAARVGIPIPAFAHTLNDDDVRRFLEDVPPPWMFKPRHAASSKGIKKCTRPDQVWERIERLGDERSEFLVEQMIEGDVYHVDSLVSEGKVVFAEAHQYWRPLFEVAQKGGIFATRTAWREDPATQKLLALNEELLAKFELVRGAAHSEYIRSAANGEFYFLETASRVGGGDVAEVVLAGTGVDLWAEWAKIELGQGERPYELPATIRRDYGALVLSRSIPDIPDTSQYDDPEICWRVDRKNVVGFALTSPSRERIESMIESYLPRIKRDFYSGGAGKTQREVIKPESLTLVQLTAAELERIASVVPGFAANVQDIYPLAPAQDVVFRRQLDGDVSSRLFRFENRARLDAFLGALESVIARHDILRTGVQWDGLSQPVQVVWRKARLPIVEGSLEPQRIDIRTAPLLRAYVAADGATGRWLCRLVLHHLAGDGVTLDRIRDEAMGQSSAPAPAPFRNLIEQARGGEHETFFRDLLWDADEPTTPFGLLHVQREIAEAHLDLDAARLREHARTIGVSAAAICHLAWAQVLARTSGRDDVLFGTVLRPETYFNTLPVRVRIGDESVAATARHIESLLAELARHQHATVGLAQRCSGIAPPTPLFSALLDYRPNARRAPAEQIGAAERDSCPLALIADDFGDTIRLTVRVEAPIDPMRVCRLMETALERLSPAMTARDIDVLPASERRLVVQDWNATQTPFASEHCIQELFEEQVRRNPDAVAVVHNGRQLTYGELNVEANRLAHYLRDIGLKADGHVAICLEERGLEMLIGMLGVWKAGGAFVALSSLTYKSRWIRRIRASGITMVLTQGNLAGLFTAAGPGVPVLDLSAEIPPWRTRTETNPERSVTGVGPKNLAYLIYTSGSTGVPKAVMVEHRGLCNLVTAQDGFDVQPDSRVLQFASFSFDACVFEVVMAICRGAALYIPPQSDDMPLNLSFVQTITRNAITHATVSPAMLASLGDDIDLPSVRLMVVAGDALPEAVVKRWARGRRMINAYGPTETTVWATMYDCSADETGPPPIGRPVANFTTYILDPHMRPAPVGVAGDLFIGGVGVARGYLQKPDLTAERFVRDPFSGAPNARMYKTGDLTRWRADGNIEFLGRNDFQVKVRGFRIELTDIEARLVEHPGVHEAAVIAREDTPGDKRLVAYYTGAGDSPADPETLRKFLVESLADYMVPAAFVRLERFPLTTSGKLDRKALPAPGADAGTGAMPRLAGQQPGRASLTAGP